MSASVGRDSRILVTEQDSVLTITLDGPGTKNAITSAMKDQLLQAVDETEHRPGVRVIVLRGARGTFCSGADVRELTDLTTESSRSLLDRVEKTQRIVERLQRSPLPVISVIEGVAAGGGIGLALAADVVICAADARFVLAFAQRGLAPDAGLTGMLIDALGRRRARALCLRGSQFTAGEAREMGLADLVVPPARIEQALDEETHRLLETSPVALTVTKRVFDDGYGSHSVEALAQALAMKSGSPPPRTPAELTEEMS